MEDGCNRVRERESEREKEMEIKRKREGGSAEGKSVIEIEECNPV